jgi:hypothetical protein
MGKTWGYGWQKQRLKLLWPWINCSREIEKHAAPWSPKHAAASCWTMQLSYLSSPSSGHSPFTPFPLSGNAGVPVPDMGGKGLRRIEWDHDKSWALCIGAGEWEQTEIKGRMKGRLRVNLNQIPQTITIVSFSSPALLQCYFLEYWRIQWH